MQLVTDNPNPLSLTFNLNGLDMGALRKVIVPKGNEIGEHIPLAKTLLEQSDAFDRVEMINNDGAVSLTLCLSPRLKQGNPNFALPDVQKHQISELVSQIQKHLSDTGQNPFHVGCLSHSYEPISAITSEGLSGDIKDAFDATTTILTPMAAEHGGSFEVVDLYDASEATLNTHETSFLSPNKTSIGVDLVVFGSCSGCSAFYMTYGQAPKKIAEILKEASPQSSMQIRHITPSDNYASGRALIFK